MTAFYLPVERNEWFADLDRVPTTSKHKDESKTYTIDFIDQLASGETISSVSLDVSGVTATAGSPTTGRDGSNNTAFVLTVSSGTDGSVEVTAVTSASRTLVQVLRFVGVPEGGYARDYQSGW